MANNMEIACFDLETSSLRADFGIVLCGVIKPIGGRRVTYRIDDQEGTVGSCDMFVVEELIAELGKYLILIAHNGVRFDRPFLNARATLWGLPPMNPRGRIIDPVLLARKHLLVGSNRLDHLAMFLQTKHQKTPVDGAVWQRAVLDHDSAALDEIAHHCVNDVLVLEEIVTKLQPYIGKIQEWGSA